jgi:hypothetical protein
MEVSGESVTVRNAGDAPAVLSLATWSPAASRPPPYWGWSSRPIASVPPDHRVCLVGPAPGRVEENAGIASRYRFVPTPSGAGATDGSISADAAAPSLFDLSVQVKDDRELYLFLVSFFGPSVGTVELALPHGEYSAANALTGEPVELPAGARKWHLPVNLPAGVGDRVIQIRSVKEGQPFAEW